MCLATPPNSDGAGRLSRPEAELDVVSLCHHRADLSNRRKWFFANFHDESGGPVSLRCQQYGLFPSRKP